MIEKEKMMPFRQKMEILVLSDSEQVFARGRRIASDHKIKLQKVSLQGLTATMQGDLRKTQLVILGQETEESVSSLSSRLKGYLGTLRRSHFCVLVASDITEDERTALSDERVKILTPFEFFETLKLEYLCLYFCRSQYFEIHLKDLFSQTKIPFPVFVQLPLNQRYLAVVQRNINLTDSKISRIQKLEGLFIPIRESAAYLEYVKTFFDASGMGLKKRVRALFMTIASHAVVLNENLIFDVRSLSDETVLRSYQGIKVAAEELFSIMTTEESVWDLLQEPLGSVFWSYWRNPWVAVYGALLSVKSGVGDPMVTLLAGLFCDVGVYELDESIVRQYLFSETMSLTPDQLEKFEKHPLVSLQRCLSKGLPLEERVQNVIVCTHERNDGRGFPNHLSNEQIPEEAQLLQLAEIIDKKSLDFLKDGDRSFRFLREKIWETERSTQEYFSASFLDKVSEALL